MSTPTNDNGYTDLRLFDKDAQDVFDASIQNLRLRLPGWEPREDATETMLMESLALAVSESIYAINRLPSTVMMNLLQLFGIRRHEGSLPTTTITLTVNQTGVNIPSGTRFTFTTPLYDDAVIFTTTETAYFPDRLVTDVAAEGNILSNDLYSVSTGTQVYSVDTIPSLEFATIGTSIIGGSAPETDAEWLDRAKRHFQRLVSTLVTPEHFRLAAMDHEAVARVKVLDLYKPGDSALGDSPGHVTVSLYGDTRALTDQEKAVVLADLRERSLASLQIHVMDPQVVPIDVHAIIAYLPEHSSTDVDNDVETALIEYLSSPIWDTTAMVRRNELITEISNVPGVDYVENLVEPAENIDLSTTASLATPGNITIEGVAR